MIPEDRNPRLEAIGRGLVRLGLAGRAAFPVYCANGELKHVFIPCPSCDGFGANEDAVARFGQEENDGETPPSAERALRTWLTDDPGVWDIDHG